MKSVVISICVTAALLFTAGCASMKTQTKQYKGTDVMLANRDIPGIIRQLDMKKERTYPAKDRVLYYLDMGMLHHYKGDYQKSNELLEQAEFAMEELYTKSVSKAAVSMLLNDNALDYSGEDYEDVYTNVFKALNYLHLNDFDAAFVEIRRINLKLDLLEDKHQKMAKELNTSKDKKSEFKAGTNKFHNSALGRWLSMSIYQVEGKRDDARIDYLKLGEAFETQPSIYNFSPPNLADPLQQVDSPVLHVVGLIGKSPYKKAKELHIKTFKDRIVVVAVDKSVDAVNIHWPGINADYYFKFSLPYIVNDDSQIGKIKVVIDGISHDLGRMEDVGNVAVQTFKVKEPIIFLKSVTRSVLKGIAAEAAKEKMKEKNPGLTGSLMGLATDVGVYASENADLRISRFFPNLVLIADIPVSEGEHNVAVEYYHKNGNLLYRDDKGVINIKRNGLNLVESWHLQ